MIDNRSSNNDSSNILLLANGILFPPEILLFYVICIYILVAKINILHESNVGSFMFLEILFKLIC